jgi:hypothetical protein
VRTFPTGTIAVVGNAPSEIGIGRGTEIDGHDHVIRFNNYLLEGYEADYGTRTTHWASNFYPDAMMHLQCTSKVLVDDEELLMLAPFEKLEFERGMINVAPQEKIERIYCTIPALDERFIYGYCNPAIHPLPNYDGLVEAMINRDVAIVPFEIIEKIGVMSAGLTLLTWLYFERGRSLKDVEVYGFNFFNRDQEHHYFEDQIEPAGKYDHNGEKEEQLFAMLCNGEL